MLPIDPSTPPDPTRPISSPELPSGLDTGRKAFLGFVTGIQGWAAIWLPPMWGGLIVVVTTPLVVWVVPNRKE